MKRYCLVPSSNISFTHAMEGGHWKQRRIVLTIRQTVDIRSIVQEKSSSSLYQYAAPVSGGWLYCDVTEVPFKVETQVGFAGLGWCDYSFIALSFLYRKKKSDNIVLMFVTFKKKTEEVEEEEREEKKEEDKKNIIVLLRFAPLCTALHLLNRFIFIIISIHLFSFEWVIW